jgi:hypothetical protein
MLEVFHLRVTENVDIIEGEHGGELSKRVVVPQPRRKAIL